MAAAPSNAEALAVIAAQRAAQARLGLVAAYLTLLEWEGVQPTRAAVTSAEWADIVLRVIYALRLRSRRVAIMSYQLVRALDSGFTLGPLLDAPQVKQPRLGQLREQFMQELEDIASIDDKPGAFDDPDVRWVEETLRAVDPKRDTNSRSEIFQATDLEPYIDNLLKKQRADDAERITVDVHVWTRPLTRTEIDSKYRALLLSRSTQSQVDFVERVREDELLSASKALDLIEDHHLKAGSNGAGVADEAVVDGGRFAVIQAMKKDRKVKVVARGTGPNPCAFCAMLASRGFVYTSIESSIGVLNGEEIQKYHPNCHCFPIVRYVDADQVELPKLSEFFANAWKTEIAGKYSGEEARRAWRRWLGRMRRENPDIFPSPFA